MYADWSYYSGTYGGSMPQAAAERMLQAATDAIDTVTFSRIVAKGWDNLTEFQQDLVRRACCMQADFLNENADAVQSAMTSYSINGVSMAFGNPALYTIVNGTAMGNAAMSLLRRTGLASLIAFGPEVERAMA